MEEEDEDEEDGMEMVGRSWGSDFIGIETWEEEVDEEEGCEFDSISGAVFVAIASSAEGREDVWVMEDSWESSFLNNVKTVSSDGLIPSERDVAEGVESDGMSEESDE